MQVKVSSVGRKRIRVAELTDFAVVLENPKVIGKNLAIPGNKRFKKSELFELLHTETPLRFALNINHLTGLDFPQNAERQHLLAFVSKGVASPKSSEVGSISP
jgi:hypothetical protein